MSLFTQLLSFNGLALRLPTICKKSSQRTSNSDSRQKKDVLKNIRFSNYFLLAVFVSLIKFSKIVFAVWNFVRSLKFYFKNIFCPSLHAFKINWTGLFYFKLNNRQWENSLYVFQRNSPKYRITRHYGAKLQTAKQTFTTSKLLTLTFLAILKWTEINLRWLIVDGCVKEGKTLTITVNF